MLLWTWVCKQSIWISACFRVHTQKWDLGAILCLIFLRKHHTLFHSTFAILLSHQQMHEVSNLSTSSSPTHLLLDVGTYMYCTCVYVYMCICAFMYICMCVFHICMSMCVCMYTHIHIHTHACTHIYTLVYIIAIQMCVKWHPCPFNCLAKSWS